MSQHIHVRAALHRKSFPKLHECMDTFQMHPKAICADMAFHRPLDMQALYGMHNVKRLPTGPHTRWPNRAEMGVRLFKKFLFALVDTAPESLVETTLSQITPAQLMRKAATVRNTQVTLCGKTPMERAMGRRPRDLMDPPSMHPEQLTTKQDLFNEKIQSWLWRHISRSCWKNEVCSSRSSSTRKCIFTGKKIRIKFSKGGSLENGWKWRFLRSRVPWWLPVLVRPFCK